MFHDFIETSVTPNGECRFGKHPTQKPESLIQHFVEILSNPNDTVLDPFMGSGYNRSGLQTDGSKFYRYRVRRGYFLR